MSTRSLLRDSSDYLVEVIDPLAIIDILNYTYVLFPVFVRYIAYRPDIGGCEDKGCGCRAYLELEVFIKDRNTV